jgi:hypothetical protein
MDSTPVIACMPSAVASRPMTMPISTNGSVASQSPPKTSAHWSADIRTSSTTAPTTSTSTMPGSARSIPSAPLVSTYPALLNGVSRSCRCQPVLRSTAIRAPAASGADIRPNTAMLSISEVVTGSPLGNTWSLAP